MVEDGIKGRGNLALSSACPSPRPCPDPTDDLLPVNEWDLSFLFGSRNSQGKGQVFNSKAVLSGRKPAPPSSKLIVVQAIDYVHVYVNGREYRADSGDFVIMPVPDYKSLHPEVRGFLIPVCVLDDSLNISLDFYRNNSADCVKGC